MKPLTIEELKALEVGDWVWVKHKDYNDSYLKKVSYNDSQFEFSWFAYSDYGTDWLAYKNKEQAEAKGEILELPCINKPINLGMPIFEVIYRNKYNSIMRETIYEEEKAKARLQELRGEK